MVLYKLEDTDDCNGKGIWDMDIHFEMGNNESVIQEFREVGYGNYCVKVRPLHSACILNKCGIRNSHIISINEVEVTAEERMELETTESNPTLIFFGGFAVLMVIAAVIGYFFFRISRGAFRHFHKVAIQIKAEDLPCDTLLLKDRPGTKQIIEKGPVAYFFLHTFENATKEFVKNLICVLRKIMGKFQLPVTFESAEEQRYKLSMNSTEWMESRVMVKIPGGDVKRKVIVVESQRAVLMEKSRLKSQDPRKRQDLQTIHEEQTDPSHNPEAVEECDIHLDNLFLVGLNCLKSQDLNTEEDFKNVLVVHLTNTMPIEKQLKNLIPGNRFYSPSCLFLLVKNIVTSVTDDPNVIANLQQEFCSAMSENEYFRHIIPK